MADPLLFRVDSDVSSAAANAREFHLASSRGRIDQAAVRHFVVAPEVVDLEDPRSLSIDARAATRPLPFSSSLFVTTTDVVTVINSFREAVNVLVVKRPQAAEFQTASFQNVL